MLRRIFTVLFFIVVGQPFAQNNFEPALQDAMLKSRGATVYSIFRLKPQWNADSAVKAVKWQKKSANQRAYDAIKSMRQFTQSTQQSFLNRVAALKSQRSSVVRVQAFWCANIIAIWADENTIRRLAMHPDVDYVYLDHTNYRLLPVEQGVYADIQGFATHGLRAIGARQLWALGYSGRGRKVLGVDTGVNTFHPTFAGRFLGDYLPLDQSYFPYNNPVSVDISSSSHGTHTIGTVLGTIASNGDTIGVAPKAYFMVSDPIVSQISEVRRLSEILECFQWALDPDGNPETVNDIPDVITNSWGLENSGNAADCDLPETLVFNALDAAGVALVFSAGNSGPGSQTIGQPAHIARSTTNIFSVGALNTSVSEWSIADFSSRGPTNCPVEAGSSLHIKPEVVAPGVNVFSAQGLNEYGVLSGTSMAAPHIAGSVLLLKEAFPNVASTEILEALYSTSTDLGDIGEDNTFGNGLINLWNAYQWLSQNHTPLVPQNGGDVKLSAMVSIIFNGADSIFRFVFNLKNIGTQFTSIERIDFKINEYVSSVDTAMVIDTGVELSFFRDYLVTQFPLEVYNRFEFYAHPQNQSDIDTINNHACVEVIRPYTVSLPFTEDFENAQFDLKGAKVVVDNPDKLFTWRADTIPQFGGSTKSATMKFRFYNQIGQVDNLNLFPILLNNPPDLKLSFRYAYAVKSAFTKDTLKVTVSTDGQNFNHVVFLRAGTNLATVNQWMYNNLFLPNSQDQWRYITIDLSDFKNAERLWIRFQTINRNGNDLFIDNIAVYSGQDPLPVSESVNQPDNIPIIYPNPAGNEFLIQFSNLQNPHVLLWDVTGREIRGNVETVDDHTLRIVTEHLSQGVYFVSLISGEIIKTQSVIISR
ncbi:MAG TPA: S8 family serine peptidase [Salinivirgaceae bacterium]|nr:S8 family serine peptidase [Salinivirgaceae bacterium]